MHVRVFDHTAWLDELRRNTSFSGFPLSHNGQKNFLAAFALGRQTIDFC
jgi:hypothetical protein